MSTESVTISADFDFASHFATVNQQQLHYITQGEGAPMLFLHGIPTSSYLWRNVIKALPTSVRAIAPDLIGMGRSDKPAIKYSVFDHIAYISGFIEALDLRDITLVLHAWGSVIGFAIAKQMPERISGLAFLEAHIRLPTSRDNVSLPVQQLTQILDMPDGGYDVVMHSNYFVNKVLPSGVLRTLSEVEMQHYLAPFEKSGSCLPLWQYLQDLPLCDEDDCDVAALIKDYSAWLCETDIPKLMLYAVPGFVTTIDTVMWAKTHLTHLSQVDLGDALHYAQESKPLEMALALNEWYQNTVA